MLLSLLFSQGAIAQSSSDSVVNRTFVHGAVEMNIESGRIAAKVNSDSIMPTQILDSMRHKLVNVMDSIQASGRVVQLNVLDSIRTKVDSLDQLKLIQKGRGIVSKSESVVQGMLGKINSVEKGFIPSGGGVVLSEIPELSIPDVGIDQIEFPNAIPNLGPDILKQVEVPEGIKGISAETPDVLDKIAADKLGPNAKVVAGNVQNIASTPVDADRIAQLAESKLGEMPGVNEVHGEILAETDYTELIKKWNSDPDYMREQALNKAKEEAVNHFVGHEQEVTEVMQKLDKAKKVSRLKESEEVVDFLKRTPNPMKSKPFIDRLILGMAMQVQVSSVQWFDFNPYVGFRGTGRINFGLGWVERVATDFKQREFVSRDHVFGLRGYGEVKTIRDFFVRFEAELVNVGGTPYALNGGDHNWVPSCFAGIKKSFNFSKYFKGNTQLLYNLYDPNNASPYLSRMNVRIGFELPIRKRDN